MRVSLRSSPTLIRTNSGLERSGGGRVLGDKVAPVMHTAAPSGGFRYNLDGLAKPAEQGPADISHPRPGHPAASMPQPGEPLDKGARQCASGKKAARDLVRIALPRSLGGRRRPGGRAGPLVRWPQSPPRAGADRTFGRADAVIGMDIGLCRRRAPVLVGSLARQDRSLL